MVQSSYRKKTVSSIKLWKKRQVNRVAYVNLMPLKYAAVSLKYLWKEYEPYFVKSESPDWINPNMDFGLEVSQALLPDDGQEESFIEKYLGCRKEELPSLAFDKYGDYLSKAKYRFDRKLEKLNANYIHKHYNGLYLFLHPTDENDIDAGALFEYMRYTQEKKKMRFDRVFLNCVKTIYVCNYENNRADCAAAKCGKLFEHGGGVLTQLL